MEYGAPEAIYGKRAGKGEFMKKLCKRLFLFILSVLFLVCACVFYGFRIEPYLLKVKSVALAAADDSPSRISIVQLSDLHIKEDFTAANLTKTVEKTNSLEPDIILFTGDLYDNYARYHDDEAVIGALSDLSAKYAKIAVWGNRDYGGGAVRRYEHLMEASGFLLLKNESRVIPLENGKKLLFTGLDDALLGNPDAPESAGAFGADYSVLITHEPDPADDYAGLGYDIIVSGHSHGGQIRLPFLRSITTALGEKYTGGLYTIGGQGAQLLYVNTGIGTTHISARFGVVPEITLFKLSL